MTARDDHVAAVQLAYERTERLSNLIHEAQREYRETLRPALHSAIGEGNQLTQGVWLFMGAVRENLESTSSDLGLIRHELTQYRDNI